MTREYDGYFAPEAHADSGWQVVTGEAVDYRGHRYLYAYDTKRDVAAIDYGSDHVGITVAGEWQPGRHIDPEGTDSGWSDTENVWDEDSHARAEDHPFTIDHLVRLALPYFGRD